MLELKYYRKVNEARRTPAGPLDAAAFDLDELGTENRFRRLFSRSLDSLQLAVFWFLRELCPNPRIGRLVIVTRACDVEQVLADNDAFRVPFGPDMTDLAHDAHSVLGNDGEMHACLRENIERAFPVAETEGIAETARRWSEALLASSGGRIDAVHDLIMRVSAEVCSEKLGLDLQDPDRFSDWTIATSNLLFADWFGSERNRRVALQAAPMLRAALDRAIGLARRNPGGGAVVDRLLRPRGHAGGPPSDGEVRATLMALATGFIPTVTLAAGRMLDGMLRRPATMRAALRAARADDRVTLQAIILEAGRRNPALSPGQLRYAVKRRTIAPGTARARTVRPGMVVLAATRSALRDRRAGKGGAASHALMFGAGPHACLGAQIAPVLITEILLALLKQDNLRRAAGAAGVLTHVGPYPRHLTMVFEQPEAPSTQSMVVVCVPVAEDRDRRELRGRIRALGNPVCGTVAEGLDATDIVHFASLSVIDADAAGKPAPHILLELNADGGREAVLWKFAEAAEPWLGPIVGLPARASATALFDLLRAHAVELHGRPWGATGLNFNGTPEFSVSDIGRQKELADFCRAALDVFLRRNAGRGSEAMQALGFVRAFIQQGKGFGEFRARLESHGYGSGDIEALAESGMRFRDYLIRPSGRTLRIATWVDGGYRRRFLAVLRARDSLRLIGVGSLVWLALTIVVGWTLGPAWFATRLLIGGTEAIAYIAAMLGVLLGGFLLLLRFHETRDVPDDRAPPLGHVEEIARTENSPGYAQNHITAVTSLKPGWFRRLTLSVSLHAIDVLVRNFYRPGFVLNMGSIHYAKWFRLPGTRSLVFLANYDGSWESYLEDFIVRAHAGQSAAWSNGIGFPRTRFLLFDGARDGERFKRWVRRQQVATQCWYSRFPALTTDQIRSNALVHDGLMHARTDTAARAWLECFGSTARPPAAIESEEVQSLVFRAMGKLRYSAVGLYRLPEGGGSRTWLERVMAGDDPRLGAITFGDRSLDVIDGDRHKATFVMFSASGLARLGLAGHGGGSLATFPAAFRIGMSNRGRVLGDLLGQPASSWRWMDAGVEDIPAAVGPSPVVDVAIVVLAARETLCAECLDAHTDLLGKPVSRILTQPVKNRPGYEHFGFRDGISQPVIRGTGRAVRKTPSRDVQEAGEFILGYRNNQGFFPLTPVVEPELDRHDLLAVNPPDFPSQFPEFGSTDGTEVRDFGRNGTFVVLRELLQDVEGFNRFVDGKVSDLDAYENLQSLVGKAINREWVASKMVGRSYEGVPLVDREEGGISRRPAEQSGGRDTDGNAPRGRQSRPDNDFDYGVDDPQGLRCPFGAHIRRTNPRTSLSPDDPLQQVITNRHRLLRRGRSFERQVEDKTEKGLLFVGICADIERQFEFLQQTWINSPGFHKLMQEPDPLISPSGGDPKRRFTIPTTAGPVVLDDMRSFVRVIGGGYFFMPSRSALSFLVRLQGELNPDGTS